MNEDDTIPGEMTITPAMSEKSRKRAEAEALKNAQGVVEKINEDTEGSTKTDSDGVL